MTNYKLKKANNQIYIVDVGAEINPNDLFITENNQALICEKVYMTLIYSQNDYGRNKNGCFKVKVTPEQIDIDNLWDKYLEALWIKNWEIVNNKSRGGVNPYAYRLGYLQAKKETSFSESDLLFISEKMYLFDPNYGETENEEDNISFEDRFKRDIQKLKLSKIPECEVEVETEDYCQLLKTTDIVYCSKCQNVNTKCKRLKLYDNKVTITKLIL